MSWYREADKSSGQAYVPPKATRQELDAGGNYVDSAAAVTQLASSARKASTLHTSVIE